MAALHCVMLPERMEGKFRPPYLPVLASRFLDPCQAVSSVFHCVCLVVCMYVSSDQRSSSSSVASRVEENWSAWT